MFCKNCGKEIGDNIAFCPECGSSTGASASAGYEDGRVSTGLEDGMGVIPPVKVPNVQKAQKDKKVSKSTVAIIILSALLVVAALVIVIVLQNNKLNEKSDNKSGNTTNALEVLSQQNYDDSGNKEPVVEVTTDLNVETTTRIEEVTEVVTDKSGEKVTEIVTQKPVEATTKPTTTKPATTKPQNQGENVSSWSTSQIISFYNSATSNVVSKKPGYTKTRSTKIGSWNAGGALSPFKDIVFQFLGIGDENKFQEKVSKGTNTNDSACGDYLRKSTLTTSDVTSAKIEKSGSNYVITLAIKPGKSYIEGGDKASNNSPIDKTGICVGNTDRSGFDHKNAILCYNAIGSFASTAIIDEETHGGKVVATVTPDGKIVKLVISWEASANLSKILASKGDLSATTTVTYDKFGW